MRFTLGKKIVLLVVAFTLFLCGICIAVSMRVIQNMNDEHYISRADEVSATIARVIDQSSAKALSDEVMDVYGATDDHVTSEEWGSDEFNAYIAHYAKLEQSPVYQKLLVYLRRLQEVNGVDCLYMIYVVPQDRACVYLVDADEYDPCPIGCIDPLYEVNYAVIDDPTVGFPAYITNTEEYGWLVSAAAPVYDSDGEVVCYAVVDISMELVKQQEAEYVWGLSLVIIGLGALLCMVTVFLVRRFITRPLKTLADAAVRYCDPNTGHSTFEGLDIHTNDEIEELHQSMISMEHDIDSYVDNLVQTRVQLMTTKEEAALMNILAHKDALTGIRNKLAFDQEMLNLDTELAQGTQSFGLAVVDLNDLKVINDTYGHDCGNVSLQRLSSVICSVFVHSPVFRIGGDEFAIVLRENDYEKIEYLVDEFDQELAELAQAGSDDAEPWERISAAIGYALYDPQLDEDTSSVFRRADQQMYQRKKQMKGTDATR